MLMGGRTLVNTEADTAMGAFEASERLLEVIHGVTVPAVKLARLKICVTDVLPELIATSTKFDETKSL